MRKFFINYGLLLIINLLILLLGIGSIIQSLFWKEVPYNMQHWTKDLHSYLIYFHIVMTITTSIALFFVNFYFFIDWDKIAQKRRKKQIQNGSKEQSDE